jgi:hypothetical protein
MPLEILLVYLVRRKIPSSQGRKKVRDMIIASNL